MPIDRRQFVAAVAASCLPAHAAPSRKAYGSGSFGEWIEDEFGLPAFRYTCDQTRDPRAVTQVSSPGILSSTEHVHQVGNDRLVAIASNYGHVQVRQDEGAPKYLNAYSPERSQFGGGIGYLTVGTETLSTFYAGGGQNFDRVFGVGYFRKKVASDSYSVDQAIVAPFGDDPVLLSQVTIANHTQARANLRWIEYWGCHVYQFSFRSNIEQFGGGGSAVELRRKFGDRFTHTFRALDGNAGLLESKQFMGRDPKEEELFERMKTGLATRPTPFLAAIGEPAPEASFDDLNSPATFLVSLDAPADGFTTDAKNFFGDGGMGHPAGLARGLAGALDGNSNASGLLLERKITLAPSEQRTLSFLYGYLPQGTEVEPLVKKYRGAAASVWRDSSQQWKDSGMRFETPAEPWVKRETAWHYYYLRSSLTYDDFFGEHILSQGGIYQYSMGFQGAARDPLQHALPFLFSDPHIVKEILRYTLKEVRANGSIPYGIVGHGTVAPMSMDNSSDMPLWLLWAASEYVLATRDTAFLDEEIHTWPLRGPAAGKATVRNLLARCYQHLVDDVGVGEHGVMRMLNDDWNDALVLFWGQRTMKETVEKGESVLNSAMAAWVFDYYARMLAYSGENAAPIAHARQKAEENRKAARAQWTGKWLRRAWLGPTVGWLGEKGLWLEPQPWAIIGGVTDAQQSKSLIATMDELLRRGSPIGAMQMNQSPDIASQAMAEPGTSISGGIWPSLNATLVWALAQVDGKMAWDEWKKNTLARHAEVYPDVWYNTWSGPDTLNSTVSKHPGETVNSGFLRYTDFPIGNLHSHACTLYSAAKLLGLEFTEAGLDLAPGLPLESYRFDSPLVGVVKGAAGYEGWYAPARAGEWRIRLKLQDGVTEIRGKSTPGTPMRWAVPRS
jgi:glycosyl hydrolase family 36